MRIAMVHADLPNETRGGVAHQVHYLANLLVERGHQVGLFTFSPAPSDAVYRTHTIDQPRELQRSKLGRMFGASGSFSRCSFDGYDLVHYHGDNHFCRPRIPSIRTFYGSALDEGRFAASWKRRVSQMVLAYPLEWVCGIWPDHCVGISKSTCQALPFIKDMIPCGVDHRVFRPGGEKTLDPTILFVGTLEGRKRGWMLVDVFSRIIRPRFSRARLVMVADQEIDRPGVVSVHRPSTADLAQLYRESWVFCMPSTYEGFGIPYIEAMSSGTMVVATANPGAREILGDGSGRIVEDGDLGSALIEVLSSEVMRAEHVATGLKRVETYHLVRIAEQYESRYDRLLASPKTSTTGAPMPQEESGQ